MDKSWKQITPSDFAWERDALDFVREHLPDHEPYRAWANFEFIALDGSINEVDLLVLTPKGLFHVEVKSHPGEITGDAGSWVWTHQGKRRVFDNPRLLAERKTQKLASLLRVQRSAKQGKGSVPFITTLVFLSHATHRLEGPAGIDVCTRKNLMDQLMRMDSHWTHPRLDRPISKLVARALEEAGVKESVRVRRVGLYALEELLGEAEHFQDWRATHTETGNQRRIRIYLTHGKSNPEAERLQRAAKREFQLLEGIEHPGILTARDYQQHDHGPALVYDHDPAAERLDHFLLGLGPGRHLEMADALNLTQQIAEAVRYAHEQRLYHRSLSPQSVFIKRRDGGGFSVKIANWATAEREYESESRQHSQLSHLSMFVEEQANPYLALDGGARNEADAVYLDVFSLGSIAYLLFTGCAPAQSELELQDKLSRGTGLQVTDALDGASQALQDLIQYATHPNVGSRLGSAADFLDYLNLVEDELTQPDNLCRGNPAEARPGEFFDGGLKVCKRLGRGASSVTFVVEHKGCERVLKLAADPGHNARLRAESETLQKLHHQAIVAHHETRDLLGHTGLIIDYASDGTLSRRLREQGPVQLELLERFGDDLLGALCHLEEKGIAHRDIKPENLGLVMQGKQLHLVLFDFSLTSVSPDNYTAGTVAYMDPFIRDIGRRRWDDYAERFSCALTLYEMATGALPGWATSDGMPAVLEGELTIDPVLFDPSVRQPLAAFFHQALARDVKRRFGNAEDMRRAWRKVYLEAGRETLHPADQPEDAACPLEEAGPDTQIGLLPLTPQALDTLSRLGINKVADLLKLPRNELVRMPGVGTRTRKELSETIAQLQRRLTIEPIAPSVDGGVISVDELFRYVVPKATKATDPLRLAFLDEFLGRPQTPEPDVRRGVIWPTPVKLAADIGTDTATVRDIQARVIAQWGKNKAITELRKEMATLLAEHGGVMTAVELAEAILLRRGSVQASPIREAQAQAVTRAAVETELARQRPDWVLRRASRRVLVADNREGLGEELADYAEALGQVADECAKQKPLLSPVRALERIRAVSAPDSFAGMSNHRLLRLAAAASESAALSSRAEFYARGMPAADTLELAQGALLGVDELSVDEVHARIRGRYPEADPLPGRPQLDELMHTLDMGFRWQSDHQRTDGKLGAYILPRGGPSSHFSIHSDYATGTVSPEEVGGRDADLLGRVLRNTMDSAGFLALTVRPGSYLAARDRLLRDYPLRHIGFDALLLRHLHRHCEAMAQPPRWDVVLKADAAEPGSLDRRRLTKLVREVLPAMAEDIQHTGQPVLLTEPGLIARYGLVDDWLGVLRRHLLEAANPQALLLLIAADVDAQAAVIDHTPVPAGAGSREFVHIPSTWAVDVGPHTQPRRLNA